MHLNWKRPFTAPFVATILSLYAVVGCSLTLAGWTAEIPRLTDWLNRGIGMQFNAAIAGACAGMGVLGLLRGSQWITRVLGAACGLIGFLTLFQHTAGLSIGIDTFLFTPTHSQRATAALGRMGPVASSCYTLVGTALILASISRQTLLLRRTAATLTFLALVIAAVPFTGYLYGADALYGVTRLTAIAFQTATIIIAIAVALILSIPDVGINAILQRSDAGATVLRRLIVPLVALIFFLMWLDMQAQRAGLYDVAFGNAVLAVLMLTVLISLILITAFKVSSTQQGKDAILESALDCIITMDATGRIVEFNPAAEATFGFPRSQAIGRFVADLIIPARLREAHWVGLRTFLSSGKHQVLGRRIEMPALRADGTEFPIELAITATMLSGRPPIFTAYLRDISEQRAINAALRDSEAKLRLITDATPALMSYIDREGRYQFANKAYEDWFGVNAMAIRGKHLREVLGDNAFEAVRHHFERALSGKQTSFDAKLPYKSGGTRFIHADYVPDVRTDGTIAGVFALVTDITDRKRIETAIAESERRFKTLSAFAPVGMFETDPDGNCLYVNDRWCAITGMTPEQARGHGWANALHPEDRERVFQEWYAAAQAGHEFVSEYRFVSDTGRVTWVAGRGIALRDVEGTIMGHVGTVVDISQQKAAEQVTLRHTQELEEAVERARGELHQAHEQQRAAERLVSIGTLATGLGHDMANLLLPIAVRLDLVAQNGTPEQIENVRAIKQSMRYLQNLSSSLKALATDPNKPDLAASSIDLNRWWIENSPLLKNVLPHGVLLEKSIPPDLPSIRIATHQLTQALFNLVQNAGDAIESIVDTAGAGKFKVIVWAERDDIDGMVKVGVTDNGPGMTDEVRAHCMEPFFSTKPRAITTGMGLPLVRGIVQRAGGSLQIDSKVGEGTSCILRLPVDAKQSGVEPPGMVQINLRDPRKQSFTKNSLARQGFQVSTEDGGIPNQDTRVWVTDSAALDVMIRFLEQDANRRVIYVGIDEIPSLPQVRRVKSDAPFGDLLNAVTEVTMLSRG